MKTAGRAADRVSVSQALKHFVRDWAAAGANERDAAFPCILETLKGLFPNQGQEELNLLLPGAGLGRLGHEIAKLPGKPKPNPQTITSPPPILTLPCPPPGFRVTNNEWSAFQNLAYRFLEQHPSPHKPNTSTLHPFLDSWSHHRSTADMLRAVAFPHVPVDPRSVVLVEGDFTTAFSGRDSTDAYDVVVTHFFIDTARNLASYLDTIERVLKPGGYWVNFGPLLYGSAPFVQLSLEELVAVAEGMGFEFIEAVKSDNRCGTGEETIPGKRVYGVEAVYGFDERALTRNAYEAQFWVARRG
jgi:carnosine N-methyltransferase